MPDEHARSTMFSWSLDFAERVVERSKEPHQGVDFLFSLFSGMVFNVARRLIEAKEKTGLGRHEDEALIVLCNRLFNDSFSGYLLLKRGLIGPANLLLRSALEVTNLAALVGDSSDHAAKWLSGHEYTAGEVRRLLDTTEPERAWYAQLSKATHANYLASRSSIYRVEEGAVDVLLYGARFTPKGAGLGACAFLWLHLSFLNLFYARNSERLADLDLLWPASVLEAMGSDAATDLGWERVLELWAAMLTDVQAGIESLPPDHEDVPLMVRERLQTEGGQPTGD